MSETLQEITPFKKLTDNEVVAGLKVSTNEKELKFFQYEFYNRYAPFIYKVGCQKCRNFQDSETMAREILQLTFIIAFKSINRFAFPEGVEPEKCKLVIKAWLGKIANREFLKEIGKRVNEAIDFDSLNIPEPSYDPFALLLNDDPIAVPSEFRIKLQEAMNELSEQDKHIVLTYAGEGCINSTQHLSTATMNYLCEHYQTTSEAIRQRKKRALDKIKSICFK